LGFRVLTIALLLLIPNIKNSLHTSLRVLKLCRQKQIQAQFGCICWMLDAHDGWSLLSLPFNGLPLA